MAKNESMKLWWANLAKEQTVDKFDMAEDANRLIEKSDEKGKKEIIEYLTRVAVEKKEDYAIALKVLETHCTPRCLRAIYEKARSLNPARSDIADYLRVLGQQGAKEYRHLLEDYLLNGPLNENHQIVQWSTYPKFPKLFAKAYSRFLIETNYKRWTGSAIVEAFMDCPEALKVLKAYLEKKNKDVWLKLRADLQEKIKSEIWDKECNRRIEAIL